MQRDPTFQIGQANYRLERRAGVLINTQNPKDVIRLSDIETHLIAIAKGAPISEQMVCLKTATALDVALGRPQGSTTTELLTVINERAAQPAPVHELRRSKSR